MYLHDENFDHSKHYAPPKTMYIDDRIMEFKPRISHQIVALYTAILDKISLSESGHKKEGKTEYINADGQYFCRFSEKDAKREVRIKGTTFKDCKAFLKEIGLIDYPKQAEKKDGCASEITVTPWDVWVRQNGLYSEGKWIVPPSIENFYNPADIVKVQPPTIVSRYAEQCWLLGKLYSLVGVKEMSDGTSVKTDLLKRNPQFKPEQIIVGLKKNGYEIRDVS